MSYRQVMRIVQVFFLIILFLQSHAQERFSQASLTTIEEAIRNKRNLQDVSVTVSAMLQEAKEVDDWAVVARCYNYLLQIADQRSEDSLFFGNARFIDSILQAPASPPLLQAVMHLMKAKRLSTYIDRFYHLNNRSLIGNYNAQYKYSRMDGSQLERLAKEQYDTALLLGSRLPVRDINDLLWLSDDPLLFFFKPVFADLVYVARLETYQRNAFYNSLPESKARFRLSPDAFMQSSDTTTFSKPERPVLEWYRQWGRYHRPHDPEAFYFIESLARKFFYEHTEQDLATRQTYESYLQQLAVSPYPAVKVHGIYQLCLLWNRQAEAYNPSPALYNGYSGYNNYTGGHFDSPYRHYYNRVLDLYAKNEGLLDSFRYIKVILAGVKREIEAPGMTFSISGVPLPNRPAPAFLHYRNITRMYMRIVRINYSTVWKNNMSALTMFLNLPAVSETVQLLPSAPDHQWHNAYTRIDPLPEGRYVLLYSDAPVMPGNTRINFHPFQSTGIAAVTNSERVYVLDRQTGLPVAGAAINYSLATSKKEPATGKFILRDISTRVGSEGWADIHTKEDISGSICSGRDTAGFTLDPVSERSSEYIYNKNEDDGLMDYYEDNIRLELFTDRAIYRPGQRVFFKGIFTVRHPKTGELLVLNWHNLRLPFYQKILYKLMLAITRKKIELYVNDPFNHETDTLRVIPNKYGSVAGSFLLSKNAPTGSWRFSTGDLEIADRNEGEFSVEEYKRPAFELKMEKPRTRLYLGDSFQVKARVIAFTGSQLNGTRIRYSVTAEGSYLPSRNGKEPGYNSQRSIISDAEGFTDAKGELVIKVTDTALLRYRLTADREWHVSYLVKAEAIDATGESHEESVDFTLSTRPLAIRISMPNLVERSRMAPLYLSCESAFEGAVTCPAEVRLFRKAVPARKPEPTGWPAADVWLYPEKEWQTWFPGIGVSAREENEEAEQLIYTTSVIAGGSGKLEIPGSLLLTGEYRLEVTCAQGGKTLGEYSRLFSVFDKAAATWPAADKPFEYLAQNTTEKGKQVDWITGVPDSGVFSVYQLSWCVVKNGKQMVRYEYRYNKEEQRMHTQRFTIPDDAVEKVLLSHFYLYKGSFYKQSATVWITPDKKSEPEIIVEQYRKQLVPGGRQTFSVSVKTGSERRAAELMTTMYDASLDKLEDHHWNLPENSMHISFSDNLNGPQNGLLTGVLYPAYPIPFSPRLDGKLLWWMNSGQAPGKTGYISGGDVFVEGRLSGRVAGLSIADSPFANGNGLNDVVVIGYGTQRKNLTGALINIRGTASLPADKNMVVIIDGVPYEGELWKLDPNSIVETTVLKGADATALYGGRAATGALIISTKGPLHLPGATQEPPPPVIRKNFAETAFFFPQIHAGRHGLYSSDFTLPESVTSWRWKMLAHTRSAAFVYAERTLTSQLPLMVQPAVPRFLYPGDRIMLRTRISNLDTTAVAGVLKCIIEDVVTGRDIITGLLSSGRQRFTASARSSTNGSFMLTVPATQLNPIRIKITGATNAYGDGEEYVIPVLARKMLVVRSVPLNLRGGETITPDIPSLPGDAEPYGLGLSVDPQSRSALLNALPYLALYPYGCAEQTFGKMLAHAIAIRLMQTDTAVQQSYRVAVAAPPAEEAASIPEAAEETMPWLQLNHYNQLRQRNLLHLLDTNDAHRQMEDYFRIIEEMQQSDGGISWFKGGISSEFVSAYLLAGFGKMQHDHLLFLGKKTLEEAFPKFLSKLINYSDRIFCSGYSRQDQSAYLYSRSFWLKAYPPADSVKSKADPVLNKYWMNPPVAGPGPQAAVITATLRWADEADAVYRKALEQLKSIWQLAIHDPVNGIRWKAIADQDDLTSTSEERVAKVAEAFETAGAAQETVAGIIRWLLSAKQEHRWSSTKSTAEVVSLMMRQPASPAEHLRTLEAELTGKKVQVTNDLMSGHAYQFLQHTGSQFTANGNIFAPGTLPVSGALSYYYFTAHPPLDSTAGAVQVNKALYRKDAVSGRWEPLLPGTPVSIADKIKIMLTVSSAKLLQFVLLEDKRAAALEPANGESGYQYEGGLYFYRSVRDASLVFFIEKIPAGIYTISYETVVAKEGSFADGFTSLQCMYQPAVQAYSGGGKLEVALQPAAK